MTYYLDTPNKELEICKQLDRMIKMVEVIDKKLRGMI